MIEILDPTVSPAAGVSLGHSPRPVSLEGKTIGLIENTKFNSDRLLQKIGDLLVSEYGAASTRMWHKHNAGVPAHDQIIDELKASCDVMVAGIGD